MSGLVVMGLMTTVSGCFGPFNLTRSVYHWDSGIKGSPFVFNAIQFWSDSNPVKVTKGSDGFPVEIRAGDATMELTWSPERWSSRGDGR